MSDHDDVKPGDKTKDQPPPATDEDQLSPAKVVRDRQRSSRTERLGDSTPTGPATSPPADPEAV